MVNVQSISYVGNLVYQLLILPSNSNNTITNITKFSLVLGHCRALAENKNNNNLIFNTSGQLVANNLVVMIKSGPRVLKFNPPKIFNFFYGFLKFSVLRVPKILYPCLYK